MSATICIMHPSELVDRRLTFGEASNAEKRRGCSAHGATVMQTCTGAHRG